MKVYTYDIEVYPNLFMCAVKSLQTGKIKVWTVYKDKEINQLEDIWYFFRNKSRVMVGYNSLKYDNTIIYYILDNYAELRTLSEEEITDRIYEKSKSIISKQRDGERVFSKGRYFRTVDLMEVTRIGFATKSLKRVAVNLKWPLIQDLPIPFYENVRVDQFDTLKKYNINDVNITEEEFKLLDKYDKPDELGQIGMRDKLSHIYQVDVLTESDSALGLVIFQDIYCKLSGISKYKLRDLSGDKYYSKIADIISPKVSFKTKPLQDLLIKLASLNLGSKSKIEDYIKPIHINGTRYDLKKGGLHSHHKNEVHHADNNTRIFDIDVSSYYPYIIINEKISPKHLNKKAFIESMRKVITDRIKAKREKDEIKSYAMKIGANSVFGRMGFEEHWLFDIDALYGVTINGQLFLLMLIEMLELKGIKVIYANTDGITVVTRSNKQLKLFRKIYKAWEKKLGYQLEEVEFKDFYIGNVNNYYVIKKDGSTKKKGYFDPLQYKNPMKAFKYPIVYHAVEQWLLNRVPPEVTIINNANQYDIYDYCMSQKIGPTFDDVILRDITGKEKSIQRTSRFFMSNSGYIIKKVKITKDGKAYSDPQGIFGRRVELLNDCKSDKVSDYDVNFTFYVEQAYKIIGKFFKLKKDLFD